jgi:hypothetical protein
MKNGFNIVRQALILCTLILLVTGCKTTSLIYGVNINGMVYDFDNRPVAGYHLKLNDDLEVVTDITGRFTFEKVKLGEYLLTGESNRYETYEGKIIIYDQDQVIYLRIPSFSQLINLTDKALEANNLQEAEGFLKRAAAMNIQDIDVMIYEAVLAYRYYNIEQAIRKIEQIKVNGYRNEWLDRFYDELRKIQPRNSQ